MQSKSIYIYVVTRKSSRMWKVCVFADGGRVAISLSHLKKVSSKAFESSKHSIRSPVELDSVWPALLIKLQLKCCHYLCISLKKTELHVGQSAKKNHWENTTLKWSFKCTWSCFVWSDLLQLLSTETKHQIGDYYTIETISWRNVGNSSGPPGNRLVAERTKSNLEGGVASRGAMGTIFTLVSHQFKSGHFTTGTLSWSALISHSSVYFFSANLFGPQRILLHLDKQHIFSFVFKRWISLDCPHVWFVDERHERRTTHLRHYNKIIFQLQFKRDAFLL